MGFRCEGNGYRPLYLAAKNPVPSLRRRVARCFFFVRLASRSSAFSADTDPWETVKTALTKAAAKFKASEGKPVVLVVDHATYLLNNPQFLKMLLSYAEVCEILSRPLLATDRPVGGQTRRATAFLASARARPAPVTLS